MLLARRGIHRSRRASPASGRARDRAAHAHLDEQPNLHDEPLGQRPELLQERRHLPDPRTANGAGEELRKGGEFRTRGRASARRRRRTGKGLPAADRSRASL